MAFRKTKLALLAALAVQQISNPALAQTAAALVPDTDLPEVKVQATRQTESYYVPTGKTGAKIEAPLRDIPQTINVIPQQLLRDQGTRSIQDVLKNVPGVGFHAGDGQRDQVTIRGFSALSDQYIDGVRDDAMYFRSLYNTNEIEVLKGPASVLYGRGSAGGIINRITKKPFFNDAYELTATVGSFSEKNTQFDLNKSLGDRAAAIRILGESEDSKGFRDNSFLQKKNINPQLLLKPSDRTLILISAERTEDNRLLDFGIPALNGKPADVPITTWYGSNDPRKNDYNKSVVTSLSTSIDHKINDAWSFKQAVRYYDYTLDRNQTTGNTLDLTDPTAPKITLRRANVKRHDTGTFSQSEFIQKLNLGDTQHLMLYGFEYSAQNKDQFFLNQTPAGQVALFNPVAPSVVEILTRTTPNALWSARTDGTGNYNAQAFYWQDLMTLSPQWKALAGVRRDQFLQEYFDNTSTAKPYFARTDRAWSPRIGAVWQPTETQSYFASWSRSFQPSGGDISLAAGSELFPPEVTRNIEIGSKLDLFNGKAALTAALFKVQRDNIKASFVPAGAPAGTLAQTFNIGQQTTTGLEVTFAGEVGNGWNISSGLALMDPVISKSGASATRNVKPAAAAVPLEGKRPAIAPTSSANLWLTRDMGDEWGKGWSIGSGLNYVSAMYADVANSVQLPSYVTMDAGLYYNQISKKVSGVDVGLNIKNLLNKTYYVSAQSDVSILPGAPRSVELTVRYKF